MKTPRVLALVLLISSLACTSCKTAGTPDGGGTPPVVSNFVGIVGHCGTVLGGPIAGAEIPKIVTALSNDPLNFGKVEASLLGIISELTGAGFIETEAINFVACVVEGELGRAERDARLDDDVAARRMSNARTWLAAHQVTFAPAAPGPGSH